MNERPKSLPRSTRSRTSSIPGMLLTLSRFSVVCSFLSSCDAALCTAGFVLRTVPFPPMRPPPAANFCASFALHRSNRGKGEGE